jgi:3-dehydroquinate dehydratase/shikimate dehydrogenase
MGEMGQFVRILGPVFGNYFDYVCIDNDYATASGQLTLNEFLNIYHYRRLNKNTKIYALIGHPVGHSIGHLYHNARFQELNLNAVYVKIDINSKDLASAMEHIALMNFQGLSVTMPHKKAIPGIIGANFKSINTLKRIENKFWQALNTDGIGALKAIQGSSHDRIKSVLILGGGGAALAIAEVFILDDYQVYILNPRTQNVKDIPGTILNEDISHYPQFGYVINTIPSDAYYESSKCLYLIRKILIKNHVVMDIDYSCESMFIKYAKDVGCKVVPGLEMYYAQAQQQLNLWLDCRPIAATIKLDK